MHNIAPAPPWTNPTGQLWQPCLPVAVWNWPSGQFLHDAFPSWSFHCPTGQSEHPPLPLPCLPLAQSLQLCLLSATSQPGLDLHESMRCDVLSCHPSAPQAVHAVFALAVHVLERRWPAPQVEHPLQAAWPVWSM